MAKKSFIISAEYQGVTKYLFIDTVNSRGVATDDISLATVYPNKLICNAVIKFCQPVIDKECPGCVLNVIAL